MVKLLFTYLLVLISFPLLAQEITVKPVATKLKGDVFAPAFYKDQLVVCSNQKDKLVKTIMDGNEKLITNLYVLLDTNGSVERFDEKFKTDYNDGPITIDGTGKYMIISRNQKTNQKPGPFQTDKNPMGLYWSSSDYYGWSAPKALPFVDTAYQFTHPGISLDGTTLVFSSNKPGGYGGFDIWLSYRNGDKWSDPVNAGKGINSKDNEVFPSLEGRNIYFSSDRKGLGGLDIYSCDTSTQVSKIAPAPLNSAFDDFGLISADQFSHGYFSTNRNGKDEIWSYTKDQENYVDCDSIVPRLLCYNLAEEQATELGSGEHLVYKWDINGVNLYGISIDYCFPGEGAYEINLDIIDTIINQTFFNQSYYYLELTFEEQPFITSKDTVLVGEKFNLNSVDTNLPEMDIKGYDWIISDGTTSGAATFDHTFNKAGEYRVQLGVEGISMNTGELDHDCVYKMIYCFDKLPNQANVVDENILVDTGKVVEKQTFFEEETDSSDISYSIEVIRTKEKLDNDNFLFQLMETYGNVKIHFVEEDQEYSYLIGNWENLEDAHPTWRDLIEKGYDEAVVRSIDLNKIADFQLDNSFVLDNVRFDPKSWSIRKDAIPDLQNIIEIMIMFPDIDLTVEAHTDDNGDEQPNLELSLKRAESVKKYFVSKGVDAGRIKAEGFGEANPVATNDTPEGREANRRVEFTFVK